MTIDSLNFVRPQTLLIIQNLGNLVQIRATEELELDKKFLEDDFAHSSVSREESSGGSGSVESVAGIAKGIFWLITMAFCGQTWFQDTEAEIKRGLLEKQAQELKVNEDLWKLALKPFYTDEYNVMVKKAFKEARHITKEKEPEDHYMKIARISLVAFIIIAAIGVYVSLPALKLIGVAYSSLMALFLCAKQGMRNYEEWRHVNNLKELVKQIKRGRDANELDSTDEFNSGSTHESVSFNPHLQTASSSDSWELPSPHLFRAR